MPNWTQLSPSPKPSARYEVPGVFDAGRNLGVIQGGNTSEGGDSRTDETWEWNGSVWTLKAGAGGLWVRGHAMAYGAGSGVPGQSRVISFGGWGAPGELDDPSYITGVQQYDGTSWGAAETKFHVRGSRFLV